MFAHRPGFNIVQCQSIESLANRQVFARFPEMAQDLVNVPEVAQILGISRQRVHQLIRAYPDFPEPEAVLAVGRIWKREDIVAWAEEPSSKAGSSSSRMTLN